MSIASTTELSLAADMANSLKNFDIRMNESHLVELEFDGATAGKAHDFRPSLPLIFRW